MNLLTSTTDPRALRDAFANVPQTVVALCGLGPDRQPRGLAASSFTTVSLDPPLVSVAVAYTSSTWPTLRAMSALGVSVLAEDQDGAGRALAGPATDRFTALNWRATDDGAVLLDDAVATFQCRIAQEIPAGDHSIVVLRIESLATDGAREPLVFHSSVFRRLEPRR